MEQHLLSLEEKWPKPMSASSEQVPAQHVPGVMGEFQGMPGLYPIENCTFETPETHNYQKKLGQAPQER